MAPIKQVNFERTYDAPRDQVWRAWTEPGMIREWWGPDNVEIPECEIDLRVGGTIYIVMEAGAGMGPYQGTRWPMRGTFTVIEPGKKLVYAAKAWTEGKEATTEIEQVTELVLADENGRTRLTLTATVNRIGPDAKMAIEGMQYGFTQQLAKLDRFLAR